LVRQGKWVGGEIYASSLESGGDLVENSRSSEMCGRQVVSARDRSFLWYGHVFSIIRQPTSQLFLEQS